MKKFAFACLMLSGLVLAGSIGCGEPSPPPPGSEGSETKPADISLPDVESNAPAEDASAPTDSSTEKDSAAGASEEK
jgi:hypothetical protein